MFKRTQAHEQAKRAQRASVAVGRAAAVLAPRRPFSAPDFRPLTVQPGRTSSRFGRMRAGGAALSDLPPGNSARRPHPPNRGDQMTPSEQLFYAWFLSGTDKTDHAVTDHESAEAIRNGSGLREALCGHLVVPSSLTSPPGPRCRSCLLVARAGASLSNPDLPMADSRRRSRASALLRWLFRRPARSAECTVRPAGQAPHAQPLTSRQVCSTAAARHKNGTE